MRVGPSAVAGLEFAALERDEVVDRDLDDELDRNAAVLARRLLASQREHGDRVPSKLRTLAQEFEVDVPVTAPWARSPG